MQYTLKFKLFRIFFKHAWYSVFYIRNPFNTCCLDMFLSSLTFASVSHQFLTNIPVVCLKWIIIIFKVIKFLRKKTGRVEQTENTNMEGGSQNMASKFLYRIMLTYMLSNLLIFTFINFNEKWNSFSRFSWLHFTDSNILDILLWMDDV